VGPDRKLRKRCGKGGNHGKIRLGTGVGTLGLTIGQKRLGRHGVGGKKRELKTQLKRERTLKKAFLGRTATGGGPEEKPVSRGGFG